MNETNLGTGMAPDAPTSESAQLARLALFGFILTFIAARTVVLLIMSRRMPNLYFFLRGTHVHHLNYGIFLLASVAGYVIFTRRVQTEYRRYRKIVHRPPFR